MSGSGVNLGLVRVGGERRRFISVDVLTKMEM